MTENKIHSSINQNIEPVVLAGMNSRASCPQTSELTHSALPVIENTFPLTPVQRVLEFKRFSSVVCSLLNINLIFGIAFVALSNPIGWMFLGIAAMGLIGLAISLYKNACMCQEIATNATHIFWRHIALPFCAPFIGLADRRIHETHHRELHFFPSPH